MPRPLALVALVALLPPAPASARDLQELYATARPSVVLLKVYDRFGSEAGQGTAFVVEGGLLVTNDHVVEGAARVQAVLGLRQELAVRGVLAHDARQDLAILQAPPHTLQPLALAAAPPLVGQPIVVVGNPLGLSSTLSEGIVAAFREGGLDDEEDEWLKGVPVLQISAPISPGSSGSPVLDLEGKVVGVAVGTRIHGQNLNFAVPASAVSALLRKVQPARLAREYSAAPAGSPVLRNLAVSGIFFGILALALWWFGRERR